MGFNKLFKKIIEISDNNRDRGTHFEYLVQAYLKNEPLYKNEFSDVWMLNEVPKEYNISRQDVGIDLVAKNREGNLVAIQAKFYTNPIQKGDIDSFLAELGKHKFVSGMIVASTDKWSKHAESSLDDRDDVVRIGLSELRNSQIDWSKFSFANPNKVEVKPRKELRKYQQTAVDNAISNFDRLDRGQLIMAPGTGKTFTSLKIAEEMFKNNHKKTLKVLYLVPSIQLLSQTLRSWNADTDLTITSMAVTSDRKASKASIRQDETNLTTKASDIGYPATTSSEKLINNFEHYKNNDSTELLVVFSTYQSIDVIGKAQQNGFPEFDLIIADEAHRTTGATELGEDDSLFVRVHSNENVIGNKRLYQTATPKLYGMDAKKKADDLSIVISSMDDENIYGPVFYRMGFGDAITQGHLSDYKLMVLAVDENTIQKDMQKALSDPENGLGIDDVGKIIGIWNGMVKRESFSNVFSGIPMKRAIAFSRTIEDSKNISNQFEHIINEYLQNQNNYSVNVKHVDGGMNALQKNEALDWLASEDLGHNNARILSNVRFLTEGIDVPNLDAIIFLSPRRSQIDIVQAVGRIIRKHKDKDYGYIILPIVIPSGTSPEEILDNNKTYEVIWQILNALRSVDERFEATVNKLQLNKKKPDKIKIIGVGGAPDEDYDIGSLNETTQRPYGPQLDFDWEEVEGAIYGKIVDKVGDRRYLEDWSDDVARIAARHINYINLLINENKEVNDSFEIFLKSLKYNINDSISKDQAIEMLSQHLITLPIFDALFDEYSFVKNNPVSIAMEKIIDEFSKYGFDKEQEELIPFYNSVKLRAEGIDNAEAKQKIIITLYDRFFSKAFKETTERLGIVFTPIEVVDFIIQSLDDVLKKHFNKTISNKNINILDPFTGTGTFIVQLLNYLYKKQLTGEISKDDILRKYANELHANEIVLLSYYIAAINIEVTFDEINEGNYMPFEGIVLTDTFETTEIGDGIFDEMFMTNDLRLEKQKQSKITVIMGNPPYSIGQTNENDNNQNVSHKNLEHSIETTYAKHSKSSQKRSLYDSYIKAFRWASNRIEENGIIAFVTNGSFIDSTSTDGFRKSIYEEFNHIYIYNLRGDQRTSGELSRKEGGKIFDSGSRTPIAITLLVKDGSKEHNIFYNDIGDYLTRREKLNILSKDKSILNLNLDKIEPDINHDWINQRDESYSAFTPLYDDIDDDSIFLKQFTGVVPARDNWLVGFDKNQVEKNADILINNYNSELDRLIKIKDKQDRYNKAKKDENFIKWSVKLRTNFQNGNKLKKEGELIPIMHRPFTKKWLYWDNTLNERPSSYRGITEIMETVLYMQGKGSKNEFSCLATKYLPNFQLISNGKGFPMYYEKDIFGNIPNISQKYTNNSGLGIDDTYYLIYAILHSKEYREKYQNDLLKDFPRIPDIKNKEEFIKIGSELMKLHLNYEFIEPYPDVTIKINSNPSYRVTKMKHPKKDELDKIIFNKDIVIKDIPLSAYNYKVNNKTAIHWIMEQYEVKIDKSSGILDDPNQYSDDDKYIFNLLLKIINLSVKTNELINSIPQLLFKE